MSQNTDQSYITLRVRRRAEVAVDTLLLELESASGEALPEWTPPAVPSHLPPSAPAWLGVRSHHRRFGGLARVCGTIGIWNTAASDELECKSALCVSAQ
jgi:hypothetical protein